MTDLKPEDDQAADRLAFQLLHDAYCDLASVLRNLNDSAARSMFDLIETRLVDALSRMHATKAEGASSDAVVLAAGAKLEAVMAEARGSAEPCEDRERAPRPDASRRTWSRLLPTG